MSEVFKKLNAINVNDNTEKKNGLTYLSWAWAWAELKKVYPDATYYIRQFDGRPYLYDENLGYMVMTEMTVDGITHEMWLPVMDGANKAMRHMKYSYKVKNPNFKYAKLNEENGRYYDKYGNEQTEFNEKEVAPATMFDINTAIMRCLTKNIAMFGLGLYIYAGEDLPEEEKIEDSVISAAKVAVIKNRCVEYSVAEETVCERFGIKAIEDMTEKMFMSCLKIFEKTEKK